MYICLILTELRTFCTFVTLKERKEFGYSCTSSDIQSLTLIKLLSSSSSSSLFPQVLSSWLKQFHSFYNLMQLCSIVSHLSLPVSAKKLRIKLSHAEQSHGHALYYIPYSTIKNIKRGSGCIVGQQCIIYERGNRYDH